MVNNLLIDQMGMDELDDSPLQDLIQQLLIDREYLYESIRHRYSNGEQCQLVMQCVYIVRHSIIRK